MFLFHFNMIFWFQISSEELFEGLDFKIFLGEHACSQIHGPIPLMVAYDYLVLIMYIQCHKCELQTDYWVNLGGSLCDILVAVNWVLL